MPGLAAEEPGLPPCPREEEEAVLRVPPADGPPRDGGLEGMRRLASSTRRCRSSPTSGNSEANCPSVYRTFCVCVCVCERERESV